MTLIGESGMASLDLVFNGRAFPVPKKCLFALLEQHQELFTATSYAVQSSVPVDLFKVFVNSLKTQNKIAVAKGNAASLSLLASEFFLPDLAAECAAFSVPIDPISALSDRVLKLELLICAIPSPPGTIEVRVKSHDRGLESLRQEVERQRESFSGQVGRLVSRVDELRSEFVALRGEVQAVRDSAISGGEIWKLKIEMERGAKSVSGLETLRRDVEGMKVALDTLQEDFTGLTPGRQSGPPVQQPISKPSAPPLPSPSPNPPANSLFTNALQQLQQPTARPSPSISSKPQKSQSNVEIPMKPAKPVNALWDKKKRDGVEAKNKARSLDGIISYLTKKHRGNVQEKGIVTITSKSVYSDNPMHAPKNVADLTAGSGFFSKNEPGQWVCWDFGERRVRTTHYIAEALGMKSWVVEGSLDGNGWTEIDRQTDSRDFQNEVGFPTPSFAVSKPAEFRFIRLTQTSKNHGGHDQLRLYAVEFFGTLFE